MIKKLYLSLFLLPLVSYASITPENRPLSSKEITNLMKKAKPVILGNCYPFFEAYLKAKGHKSFGYSLDADGKYACGNSYRNQTEKISKEGGIRGCNDNKLKRGENAPKSSCKIYAVGNKIVAKEGDFPKYTPADNTPLNPKEKTAILQKSSKIIKGNCAPFFEKYLSYDGYKAFGYALDSDGKFCCGQQSQQGTQKLADKGAIRFCNKHHAKYHLKTPCKLFASGNKILLSSKDYEVEKKQKPPFVESDNTKGTFIVYKGFHTLAQRAVDKTARVLNHQIRTENNYNPDKKYKIVDTYKEIKYSVNPTSKSTYESKLNEKSSYNKRASLLKVSKGHYIYSAADVACNHVYIKPYESEDMKTFAQEMTMIPTKIEGMMVSKDEKKCQKAARDAAKKVRKLGQVTKITDKDNSEIFFEIKTINEKEFDKALFSTGEKSQSVDEMLKQSMDTAMHQMVYEKLIKFVDKTDKLSDEKKETIKKDAKKALDDGTIMEYMEKLNKMKP